MDQLTDRAAEAVRLYWEQIDTKPIANAEIRETEVEIQA
jgi:hypothetical protein